MASSVLTPGLSICLVRHSDGTYWAFKEGPTDGDLWIASASSVTGLWTNEYLFEAATGGGDIQPEYTWGGAVISGDILYYLVSYYDGSEGLVQLGRYNVSTGSMLQRITLEDAYEKDNGIVLTPTHVFCDCIVDYRNMGSGYLRNGYVVCTIGGAWGSPTLFSEASVAEDGLAGYFDGTDTFYKNNKSGTNNYKLIISTGVVTTGITMVTNANSAPEGQGGLERTGPGSQNVGTYAGTLRYWTLSGSVIAYTLSSGNPDTYAYFTNARARKVFYDSVNAIWHVFQTWTHSSNNQAGMSHCAFDGTTWSPYTYITRSVTSPNPIQSSHEVFYGIYIDESSATSSSIVASGIAGWETAASEDSSVQFSGTWSFTFPNSIDVDSQLTFPPLEILCDLVLAEESIDVSSTLSFLPLEILSELDAFRTFRYLSSEVVFAALQILSTVDKGTPVFLNLLQFNHQLDKYVFLAEDLNYRLVINDSLVVPMVDFTITRFKAVSGEVNERVRVNIPAAYYNAVMALIGTEISLYRYVGPDEQLLTTATLNEMDFIGDLLAIFADGIPEIQSSGAYLTLLSVMYIRNEKNLVTLRVVPNTNIRVGDTIEYYGGATVLVSRVSTFISRYQSFTEASE